MSSLKDSILFYDNNSPQDIALVLENFASINSPINILNELDKAMAPNLKAIIDSF